MPKERVPFNALQEYLPEGSLDKVVYYLQYYKIQFTITKNRKSILGDYRAPSLNNSHRITVNGGLNKFSFLITFIHEVAHLITHEKYKGKVEPHGNEWQVCYAILLEEFVRLNIFPNDLVIAIKKSQAKPAASSCAEVHLTKALANYDKEIAGVVFVERVELGKKFATNDGRIFIKGEKRRTRYFAKELNTEKIYLFSAIYKVKLLDN